MISAHEADSEGVITLNPAFSAFFLVGEPSLKAIATSSIPESLKFIA